MRGKSCQSVILAGILACFLTHPAMSQEGISFSGSIPVGDGILRAGAVKAFEEKTKIKFLSLETPGTGIGLKALIDGKANLAGSARPLKPEEKKHNLVGHVIGYEAVAIYLHKNNPVKDLSREQLKAIFTGRIRNWKEVGGNNAPITPLISTAQNRAIVQMFEELIMNNVPYGAGYENITQPSEKIEHVSRDENSICAESLGLQWTLGADVRSRVKVISVDFVEPIDKNVRSGAYPITTPLLLVTKGLPTAHVKKFIDFMLSKEGQAIVDVNFIPVRR